MSFLAKLNIDNDEEFNILECNFSISQKIDHSNRPCGLPVLGVIKLTIESTKKAFFYEWAKSPDQLKDGEITFFKRDLMSSSKKLNFEKAYCVYYEEDFNNTNKNPMTTKLTLACYALAVNGVNHENPWGL